MDYMQQATKAKREKRPMHEKDKILTKKLEISK